MKINESKSIPSIFKKSKIDGSDFIFWHKRRKTVKNIKKYVLFLDQIDRFFIEISKDRFNHGQSLSRIDEIDLITVNLFKDQKDQKSEDRKIERSNSQP